MKVAIAFCLLACVFADVIYIKKSTITETRILGNTAELHREFVAANVGPGFSKVILQHLPHTIDEQSIRVKGNGNVPIKLLSTLVTESVILREDNEQYSQYMENLLHTRRRILKYLDLLLAEGEQLNNRKRTVDKYIFSYLDNKDTPSSVDSRIPPGKMLELLDFQENEAISSNKKLLSLKGLLNYTNAALLKVNKAISTLGETGIYSSLSCEDLLPTAEEIQGSVLDCSTLPLPPTGSRYWPEAIREKEIHLKVLVPPGEASGASYSFGVTHMATGASWYPEYDVHLDGDMSSLLGDKTYTLVINFFASVTQNTGEGSYDCTLHALVSTSALEK